MRRWVCIWYDMTKELHRETIEAKTAEEAKSIAYSLHKEYQNPNYQLTIVEEDKL